MLNKQEQQVLDNLPPNERQTLDNAKRLLIALAKGPVSNYGGIICGRVADNNSEPLRFGATSLCDAVRLLQRLGYGVERADAGGSPTWILTSIPESL